MSSLGNGIRDIIATDGIKGLFVGYYATLVRDIPYTMLELGLYENIKQLIRVFANKIDLNAQDEFVAAAVTGGIAATLTTPLDLIKTKLMMQVSTFSYLSFRLNLAQCFH